MESNINKYRQDAIKHMVSDIKNMDSYGVPPEEMWDSMNPQDYSYYCTEEDKIIAFQKAGYTVEVV